jgi:hypothetical protein
MLRYANLVIQNVGTARVLWFLILNLLLKRRAARLKFQEYLAHILLSLGLVTAQIVISSSLLYYYSQKRNCLSRCSQVT